MKFQTSSGKTYPLRGGAWLDPMNSCFYKIIGSLGSGYYLCKEDNGTLFALYIPYCDEYYPAVK